MKNLIVLICVCFWATGGSVAQISYGGTPMDKDCLIEAIPVVEMEQMINNSDARLKSASENVNKQGLTFAHAFNVSYTPENSGSWTEFTDGMRIWRLAIKSKGAYSLNLIFDRYVLPQGASLFLYNAERSIVLGAFTSKNNPSNGVLAVAPVAGDEVIVELQLPAEVTTEPELLIGAVNHDFLGIFDLMKSTKAGSFGDADYCNVGVTCAEKENPILQKRAVCKMIFGGTELCTGTLVNNTADDGKPYLITAGHCVGWHSNPWNAPAVFYFNYESPYCTEQMEGAKIQTVSGADLKVFVDSLDLALMELNEMPPESYHPYLAGWSREGNPQQPLMCIHHPQGDVKKISQSITNPQLGSYPAEVPPNWNQLERYIHWLIPEWYSGTTEGGSSGSGVFDKNNRLFGLLSGGGAACGNSRNDYYARFDVLWDFNDSPEGQLAAWLDPENTDVMFLDGRELYPSNPYVRLTNIVKSDTASNLFEEGWGYWTGHNADGYSAVAEGYGYLKGGTIEGVYLMLGKIEKSIRTSATFNLVIWEGIGKPAYKVYSQNNIPLRMFQSWSENLLLLNSPLAIRGPLYVGIEISYGSAGDTLSVAHSLGQFERFENTAFINEGGTWKEFSEVNTDMKKTALWIDLLAKGVDFDTALVRPEIPEGNFLIEPNPMSNKFTINLGQENYVKEAFIYDLNGRLVCSPEMYNEWGVAEVHLPFLPKGYYILKIKYNKGVVVKKIMVYHPESSE